MKKFMFIFLCAVIVVGVFSLKEYILQNSAAKMRKIDFVFIHACDKHPAHYKITDSGNIMTYRMETRLKVFPDNIYPHYNDNSYFITIDSWAKDKWEQGAYAVWQAILKSGQQINIFNVMLSQYYLPYDTDCLMPAGEQTGLFYAKLIEWANNPSKAPTIDECVKKVGEIQ